MESLELTIIHQLLYNKEYFNRIIPYVKQECFRSTANRLIVYCILKKYQEYNEQQSIQLLAPILLQKKCSQEVHKELEDAIKILQKPPTEQKLNSLIGATQDYFREVYTDLALAEMVEKVDNKSKITTADVTRLRDAISFTVDEAPFYDYMESFEERIAKYKEKKDKFPFPLSALTDCTNGGMQRKSLSIVMASTGGGKSIFLCNSAAFLIRKGYNVLYITCEMSVEEIAKRIDANLLNATQDSMTSDKDIDGSIGPKTLKQRMEQDYQDRDKWGHLFMKEYAAGICTSLNILQDIEELERDHELKIDVLVVDYLNLMATSRYSTKNANTYTIVKAIAEELRGIGQDLNIPVLSATQSNRSALSKENRLDGGLEQVSDSIGLPQTADFMFNIIEVPDATWKAGKWRLLKILKNRWGDPSKEYIKVRLDTAYARFSDVEGWLEGRTEKPEVEISSSTNSSKDGKKKGDDLFDEDKKSGTDTTTEPQIVNTGVSEGVF